MARIKITSGGASHSTRIVDLDSGLDITNRVRSLEWSCNGGELAQATVGLIMTHLAAVVENARFVERCPHCGHEEEGEHVYARLTDVMPMGTEWIEWCADGFYVSAGGEG